MVRHGAGLERQRAERRASRSACAPAQPERRDVVLEVVRMRSVAPAATLCGDDKIVRRRVAADVHASPWRTTVEDGSQHRVNRRNAFAEGLRRILAEPCVVRRHVDPYPTQVPAGLTGRTNASRLADSFRNLVPFAEEPRSATSDSRNGCVSAKSVAPRFALCYSY